MGRAELSHDDWFAVFSTGNAHCCGQLPGQQMQSSLTSSHPAADVPAVTPHLLLAFTCLLCPLLSALGHDLHKTAAHHVSMFSCGQRPGAGWVLRK